MVLQDMESGAFTPVFTRATDEEGVTEVEIDEGCKFNDENEKLLAGILTSSMKKEQKNQLFLYKLKENGVTVAKDAVNWFEDIEIVFPDSKVRYLPNDVRNDEDFRSFLSEALEQLDTGIFDISASDEKIDFQDFAQNVSLPLPDELIYGVENNKNGLFNLGGKYYIFFDDKDHTSLVQLKFTHMLNNKGTDFSFDDESDGTKRLLDLLPILYNMKYKDTAIYFVDEIDRSLHTKLSKYLTKTFLEESKESHSQIIFTTHDVNLINLADFSKEEIWFIEKDITGETRLRPFSDFETDPRQDIIKGYLSGRFGAVPVIRGEE
ncbi:MAG: ATP-binding protein [Eubacterium sp.]|nr:ATP-binding protein [Eubacterium sp.]